MGWSAHWGDRGGDKRVDQEGAGERRGIGPREVPQSIASMLLSLHLIGPREVPPGGAGLRVVGDGPGLFRVE